MLTFGFSKPWNDPTLLPCALLRFFRAFAHFCAHFFSLQNPAPAGIFFRTGSFTEIKFAVENAFLKFTAEEGVVITASEGLFGEGTTFNVAKNGEYYVAVNAVENAIIANGGEKCAKITTTAGKIYNLGTLALPVASENWGLAGGHQGWNTENKTPLYLIPETNTYVARNVKLVDDGFKFVETYTTTKTIEHPEVTGGEKGDWYLKPNSNWTQSNARFAIYFFGNGETWVSMKDENGDGIYVANNPTNGKKYPSMIFCRMNPSSTTNNWNNKWNQTGDITCPTNGNNLCTITEGQWDCGSNYKWSVHTPVEHQDAWTEVVEEVTDNWFGYNSWGGDYKTGWAQNWSDSDAKDGSNITVDDVTKTYDIYFSKVDDADHYTLYYTVVEFGGEAPELK